MEDLKCHKPHTHTLSQNIISFFLKWENWRWLDEDFPGIIEVWEIKNLPANAGDAGVMPGLGSGNPLPCSCLWQRILAGYSPWGSKCWAQPRAHTDTHTPSDRWALWWHQLIGKRQYHVLSVGNESLTDFHSWWHGNTILVQHVVCI